VGVSTLLLHAKYLQVCDAVRIDVLRNVLYLCYPHGSIGFGIA
jgi:hypothetical protein